MSESEPRQKEETNPHPDTGDLVFGASFVERLGVLEQTSNETVGDWSWVILPEEPSREYPATEQLEE